MELEKASVMLDALGHPTRLKVFHLIARSGDKGRAVGTLIADTEIPGATLSHHLSRLVGAGLVSQDRRGTTLVCRAEAKALMALSAYLLSAGD